MSTYPFGIRGAVRDTLLVWVIDDDYSFPEGLDLWQIKSAFLKDPFKQGMLPIWIFGAAENRWLNEMEDKLWGAGIIVHLFKGDNRTTLNRVMSDLVFWSFRLDAPEDLVMVSDDLGMDQDPRFCRFRRAMTNKGVRVYTKHIQSFWDNDYPSLFDSHPQRGYSPIPYYGYESDGETLKIEYATQDDERTCEGCIFPKVHATTSSTSVDIKKYPPIFTVARPPHKS